MSLGKAVVEVGADASGFGRDLNKQVDAAASKAQGSLSKLGKSTGQVGKRLTLGITAPLIGIAAQAVRTQASFEQSMNLIGVNAGIGGKQLADMGKLAQKMGADTIYSAGEAANAMLELSKGGFKPAEISGGGVQATMALAATEGLNLADAATIVGNAMNAFGLKAKNAASIADALAAGSVASSASVASLAEGLGNVGPIARQSGLNIQDVVAALSELDQAGIKGAEGGTALRSFLTRLVPQGKRAKDAMKALGLSFTNADGSFKSFGQITDILHNKLGKLTAAQKAERLQQIFGTYAKQAAAVFLQGGAKAYEKYTTAVNKSGTAQKLSDARMKGTAGAIEQMKGSVDTAALALGAALAPAVVDVAHKIQGLANWFTTLDSGTQHSIVLFGGLAAATGPALVGFSALVRISSNVTKALDVVNTRLLTAGINSSKSKLALQGLAGAGGMALLVDSGNRSSKAMSTLESAAGGALSGAALGAFAGPPGAAIGAAIGGLAGAAMGLMQNTKGAGDAAKNSLGSWKAYKDTLDAVSGATTAATRTFALQRLQQGDVLKTAHLAGLSDRQVVNAVVSGGKARETVVAALKKEGTWTDWLVTQKEKELAVATKVAGNTVGLTDKQIIANQDHMDSVQADLNVLKQQQKQRQHDIAAALGEVGAVDKAVKSKQADIAATRDLTGKLKGIPRTTRLAIEAEGIIPTRKGIESIAEKYGIIDGKQIRTLISATGVPFTKRQIDGIIADVQKYGGLHPSPRLNVETGAASAKIRAIINGIASIHDKTVTITTNTNANVAEAVSGGTHKKRALGGPIAAGQTYLIGEHGPELATFSRSGAVLSNSKMRQLIAPAMLTGNRSGRSGGSQDYSRSTSLTIVNPVPETTTDSLPRALSTLAFVLGG